MRDVVHQLDVLGAVQLRASGELNVRIRPLGKRVLSALAFLRRETTSIDRIVDLVWRGDPPKTAVKSLQNAVADIRAATSTDVVETVAMGYRLGPRVETDRDLLRRIAQDPTLRKHATVGADDAIRFEVLADLLVGEPWQLLGDHPEVIADVQSIERERVAASIRLATELAENDLDASLQITAMLVDRAPRDERLRHLRARHLYEVGRRAESLEEIAEARRTLREVGLDLGPALRRLEHAILTDELEPPRTFSSTGPTPVASRDEGPDPPSRPGFVGRTEELQQLERLVARVVAGDFAACLVVGPPGIGKSALARRAARGAHDAALIHVRCVESGVQPLHPLTSALAAAARASDQVSDAVVSGRPLHATEVRAVLAGLAPIVVVVDDAQWADDATASLLADVIADDPPAGVLLLVLSRPGLAEHESIGRMAEHVARDGVVLSLDPLGDAALRDLLEQGGVRNDQEHVAWLRRASGGNPLVASLLVRTIVFGDAPPSSIDSSAELNTLVAAQLAQAGDVVAAVLQWLAICDRPQPLELLAQVARLDHLDVIEAAEQATSLGLGVEHGPDVFDVAHDALRAGILAGLSASRRGSMHARFRDALWLDDDPSVLPEVAHHALRSTGRDAQELGVQATVRAARQAIDVFSPRDASRLVSVALETLDERALRRTDLIDLLTVGALAAGLVFDLGVRDALYEKASVLAREDGLWKQLGRAVLVLSSNWQQGRLDESVVTTIKEVLARLGPDGDQGLRAELLANLAGLLAVAGRAADDSERARADELALESLRLAESSESPRVGFAARQARIVTLWSSNAYEEQISHATAIVTPGSRLPYWQSCMGPRWRAIPLFCLGDRSGFRRDVDRLLATAADFPGRGSLFAAYAQQWRAMDALLDGKWGHASTIAQRSLDEFAADGNIALGAAAQLAWIALETGSTEGLVAMLDDLADAEAGLPALGVFAALVRAHEGDAAGARRVLRRVLGGTDTGTIPRDISWTATMAAIAETCALTGDREIGAAAIDSLRPWHGTFVAVSGGLWCFGAAERTTGLFHAAVGDRAGARSHLAQSLSLEQKVGAEAVTRRTRAWLVSIGAEKREPLVGAALQGGHDGLLRIVNGSA